MNTLIKSIRQNSEKGQLLILVLVFMLLGSVIITSLMGLMSTSLKTGTTYDNKSETLYAADAGIEDAMWQIKYDRLGGTFSNYNRFDFTNTSWTYELPQKVNDQDVSVNIRNIWIPQNISTPTESSASSVVNTGKLLVTGGAYGTSSFNIVLTYYLSQGENLAIDSIGVWLPPGFTYETGSSNLEASLNKPYYSQPGPPILHKGGQVIIWNSLM
jgi:hypothetical protein